MSLSNIRTRLKAIEQYRLPTFDELDQVVYHIMVYDAHLRQSFLREDSDESLADFFNHPDWYGAKAALNKRFGKAAWLPIWNDYFYNLHGFVDWCEFESIRLYTADHDELLKEFVNYDSGNAAVDELELITRFRALMPEEKAEYEALAKVRIEHVRFGTQIPYTSRIHQLLRKWDSRLDEAGKADTA